MCICAECRKIFALILSSYYKLPLPFDAMLQKQSAVMESECPTFVLVAQQRRVRESMRFRHMQVLAIRDCTRTSQRAITGLPGLAAGDAAGATADRNYIHHRHQFITLWTLANVRSRGLW